MNIQNNLQQMEITYRTINEARLKIREQAVSPTRVAGKFSIKADRELSAILTELADSIKAERQKTLVSMA